ncbi:tetratricopeptide repeat protein [Calditrichota bacterium]
MRTPSTTYISKIIFAVALLSSGCAQFTWITSGGKSELVSHKTVSDTLDKEKAMDHFLTGSIQEETGDMATAAIEYQLAHIYDPQSSEISMALAKSYLRLGHPEPALKVLEDCRVYNPEDADLLKMLARFYLRMGMKEEAITCYDQVAEIRGLEQEELVHLADLLAGTERFEEAIDFYLLSMEKYGDDAQLWNKVGLLYLTSGQMGKADSALKKVVELEPERHRVQFVLGGFAVNEANWEEAEMRFRAALAGDSTQLRYWLELVFCLNQQDRSDESLQVMDEAISIFPDVPQLYDMKGSALEVLGRHEEAIAELEKSISIDSLRTGPYITLGYIYHQQENWDASAEAYELGLQADSTDQVLLNNYAYMLSVQNYRLEDALDMVNRALELTPDVSSFLDTRGWLLYRLGRYQEAFEQTMKALEGSDDNAEIYEHLGHIYAALGKQDQATTAWRKALELDPDNPSLRALVE